MQIGFEKVTKKIRDTFVLDNISLNMKGGTVYGFQGHNGSGKTMLMRMACGLIRPSEGVVTIDGKILGKDMDFPQKTGILIENPAFYNEYTAAKNLRLIAGIQGLIGDQEIKETLSFVGLNPDDKRIYKKFSLGMKQKLGIAAAVMEKPELLILDEPFNALDHDGINMLTDLITKEKQRGALVMLACHDSAHLLSLSDQVYTIENGRLSCR